MPSQISLQIVLLPLQFTSLVTQSYLVILQTADFLVGRVESSFQIGVLLFKFSDLRHFFFCKLHFVQSCLLRLGEVMVLLL